ncbi:MULTISPECIES: transcriptional repressor [Paenibacillus]|uniref:transcriptional repressor n=1 Tax=Paenibacillus TaxID=44249 RepID=UPI00043478C0|nr:MULTISPECIES: transcriptional repressor [Paenibacillus]KKC48646.1 hypothetical protein VE23_18705 [Paenibacillus sp. D9]CDN45152.1 hypothetical protein BN871_GN_00190 [Paenibacillus sp. P22]
MKRLPVSVLEDPAVRPPGFQEALRLLERKGIALTAARYDLLQCIYSSDASVSVEELVDILSGSHRMLGATMVYSYLRVFKRLGLVRELDARFSARRYEAVRTLAV